MNANTRREVNRAAPASERSTPRASDRAFLQKTLRAYGILVALVVIWLAFDHVTGHIFLTPRNLSNLMRQAAVTGILAVGMLMVIVSGEIDLSVGSLAGLVGMIAALVQVNYEWGFLSTLLTASACGILVGLVQGLATAYARVPSFIVILGGLLVWRGVTKGASGGRTIPIQLSSFNALGQWYLDKVFGFGLAAVAVLVVAVTAWRNYVARRGWNRAALSTRLIILRAASAALI